MVSVAKQVSNRIDLSRRPLSKMKKSLFVIALLTMGLCYESHGAFGLPFSSSSSPNEASEPAPQSTSLRASNGARARMQGARTGGTSAGGGWIDSKEPVAAPSSVVHTPYFEYSYINIDSDPANVAAPTNGGHEHVYALGYDLSWDSGLIIGAAYEYAYRSLFAQQKLDTHTVSAYASAPVIGDLVASLIGGYSNGNFASLVAPGANFNGDSWFINPGVSHTWTCGNVIFNAGLSYLYTDTDTRLGGVTTNTDIGQIVAETGARVNLTDILYVSAGLQYNGITSHDFAPAAVDETWWRVNTEIGADLANGMTVYTGYARDFGHDFYDIDTVRLGLLYSY